MVQHVGLLVQVAGLKEERVEVKGHAAEVPTSVRAASGEALGSDEAQGLHVASGSATSGSAVVDVGSVAAAKRARGSGGG